VPAGGRGHDVQLTERPLKLFAVCAGGRNARQRVHRRIQDRLYGGIERSRDLVVHPHAIAPNGDQPRAAQVREMPRHRRLRQPEAVMEMADAHFVAAQQRQNPQARLVRQRLEHRFELIDRRPTPDRRLLHTFALPYITWHPYIRIRI
jgi:hypothetical protein